MLFAIILNSYNEPFYNRVILAWPNLLVFEAKPHLERMWVEHYTNKQCLRQFRLHVTQCTPSLPPN